MQDTGANAIQWFFFVEGVSLLRYLSQLLLQTAWRDRSQALMGQNVEHKNQFQRLM